MPTAARLLRLLPVAVLAAIALRAAARRVAPLQGEPPGQGAPTYAEVAPIFARACTHCHGGERPVEGLALDRYAGLMQGGASGPCVSTSEPAASLLMKRLRGDGVLQMPLDGDPLPEAELRLIEDWMRAGAKDAPASAAPAAPAAPPPAPRADEPVTWTHVAPILRNACVRCHQEKGIKGPPPEGLRLDTHGHAVAGGERLAVLPGRPDASPLLRAIQGRAKKRMPLDGPPWLPEAQVELLRRWIADGARGADGKPAPLPVGRPLRLLGTYDGAGSLDGIRLTLDGSTRVERDAVAGAEVEARLVVAADGSLRAERLRAR